MSQHDYNVANQSGASTRADLNTLFQAIAENNSGATAPATTFAFQWWADTANDILKQRNAANTAWISVMKMSTGVVLQKDTTDGIAGLTALKINFKNVANTFTSFFTNTNTAARTYTFPNKDMTVAGLDDTTVASTKLPQITITAATGAITVAGIAKYLDFQSATLTSGTPSTVNADPADLVIPSGATLGVPTTLSGRIVVVEMNNAGTSEYAVANITGGLQMDELNVISTTAISTSADSNNVWYSTTSRSNLPYRVVACFDAVNTAGAWSSPTLVRPLGGGEAILSELAQIQTGIENALSGTSVDFTGIPSGVSRVDLMISGLSTSGASYLKILMGTSGGFETTGYLGGCETQGVGTPNFSTEIQIAKAAPNIFYTKLTLQKVGANKFNISITGCLSSSGSSVVGGGYKSLSGELTQLRLTTLGGTETFTAGSVTMSWEF